MLLNHLSLTDFKNIRNASLDFSRGVNCFLGDNGMGKSNLLDAIHTLSLTKSFTGAPDSLLINSTADIALLQALYDRSGSPEALTLALGRNRRKQLKNHGKEYDRISQHIGRFPLVMAAPQDMDLIRSGGEERRRWLDMLISQSDPVYLDALLRYNRALEQRNRLLRDGCVDHNLFDAVEIPMEIAAETIHSVRSQHIATLLELFRPLYAAIAGEDEVPSLSYVSSLSRPGVTFRSMLDAERRHDEIVRHTSVGPHRDDIAMELHSLPLRRTGSQGQCKSFTIALRLAQYELLTRSAGFKPLLLLDDIFDKLDASRVERIMRLVSDSGRFGQIFITDTNRRHIDEIVALSAGEYRLWSVSGGVFTPMSAPV